MPRPKDVDLMVLRTLLCTIDFEDFHILRTMSAMRVTVLLLSVLSSLRNSQDLPSLLPGRLYHGLTFDTAAWLFVINATRKDDIQ